MANWLIKEEPTHYSFSDLLRDGATRREGVHNPLALQHLRRMAVGDRAVYYHTGRERSCVGLARISTAPRAAANDPRGSWWVTVVPVRPLRRPIPLGELRGDPALAGLDLLRLPRLSVVPVPDDLWARLLAHESATPWSPPVVKEGSSGSARGTARPPKRTSGRRRR